VPGTPAGGGAAPPSFNFTRSVALAGDTIRLVNDVASTSGFSVYSINGTSRSWAPGIRFDTTGIKDGEVAAWNTAAGMLGHQAIPTLDLTGIENHMSFMYSANNGHLVPRVLTNNQDYGLKALVVDTSNNDWYWRNILQPQNLLVNVNDSAIEFGGGTLHPTTVTTTSVNPLNIVSTAISSGDGGLNVIAQSGFGPTIGYDATAVGGKKWGVIAGGSSSGIGPGSFGFRNISKSTNPFYIDTLGFIHIPLLQGTHNRNIMTDSIGRIITINNGSPGQVWGILPWGAPGWVNGNSVSGNAVSSIVFLNGTSLSGSTPDGGTTLSFTWSGPSTDAVLADGTHAPRGVIVKNNGSTVNPSAHPILNFIPGTGVTISTTDNTGSGQTDITINSTATGGGGTLPANVMYTDATQTVSGANTFTGTHLINPSIALSSGVGFGMQVYPNVTNTGTAAYSAFQVMAYQSSVGTGTNRLLEVGTASSPNGGGTLITKFSVDNAGNGTFAGVATASGYQTNATPQNGNFYVVSANTAQVQTITQVLPTASANVNMRRLMRSSTSFTVPSSQDYVGTIFGQEAVTQASSGTHNLFASAAFLSPTITSAASALTEAANVFIKDAPTGATNNYALHVASGLVRLDGGLVQKRTTVSDAAYTIQPNDFLIAYTSLTAARIVSPPTTPVVNQIYVIKDEAGTAATNNISFSGTLDGASSPVLLSTNYGSKSIYWNGSAWFSR
jgi:hypothetical protein